MSDRPTRSSAPVPKLETDRLILRGFEDRDLAAFTAMRADTDVIRYLPGGEVMAPFAEEIAKSRIKRYRSDWARGFGVWAVEARRSGRMIGYVGLELAEARATDGGAELLYGLARADWGQGYAREAVSACLRFGFEHTDLPCITALVVEDNSASRKVLEAVGMRCTGSTLYNGWPVLGFRLDREDAGSRLGG
jgi:RimJ/RimL family protein N-acetyltransferase